MAEPCGASRCAAKFRVLTPKNPLESDLTLKLGVGTGCPCLRKVAGLVGSAQTSTVILTS